MRELRPAPPVIHNYEPPPSVPTAPAATPTQQTQQYLGPKPGGGGGDGGGGSHGGHAHFNQHVNRNHGLSPQHEYPVSGKCLHVVQFYDSDVYLYDSISGFLLTSFFSSQEAAVVVASAAHIVALEHQLFHQHCLFPEVMKRRGQLLMCEADIVLRNVCRNGLTQESFEAFIGPIVTKLREKGYARIMVYGELVNLLCERGEYWDALRLEKMWNVFLQSPLGIEAGVGLLCGYKMDVFTLEEADLQRYSVNASGGVGNNGNFRADVQVAAFREICKTHSEVRPTEKAAGELCALRDGMGKRRPEDNFLGSASAIDIPLSILPGQSLTQEQSGMVVAVLQHRIRMLEKQVIREMDGRKKEREFRKFFDKLPVGIYASYVTVIAIADKPGRTPTGSGRGRAMLYPKGRVKKTNVPPNAAQPVRDAPVMNVAFAKLLVGEDYSVISNATMTNLTSAHRSWINTFVHPDDREKLINSIEGLGKANGGKGPDGTYKDKCTYRIINPNGQVKWVLGETVGVPGDNEALNGTGIEERKYIHSATDVTGLIKSLDVPPSFFEPSTSGVVDLEDSSSIENSDRNSQTQSNASRDLPVRETLTPSSTGSNKRRAIDDPNPNNTAHYSYSTHAPGNPHKHHQTQSPQQRAGLDLPVPPLDSLKEQRTEAGPSTSNMPHPRPPQQTIAPAQQSPTPQRDPTGGYYPNQPPPAQQYYNSPFGTMASDGFPQNYEQYSFVGSERISNTVNTGESASAPPTHDEYTSTRRRSRGASPPLAHENQHSGPPGNRRGSAVCPDEHV